MIIDPNDFIPITEMNSSKVIDFQCESGFTLITKYELLNKNINYNNGVISVSDKKPDIIKDIQSLKNALKKVISMAESLLERHPVIQFMPEQFKNFDDLKTDLLINQLVFDVLAKKYQDECEPITCHAYAENHIIKYMDHNDGISVDAIDRCIRRSMSDYYERMNRSDLQEQLVRLGTNLEEFNKYYTPELKENSEPKKPEFV